MVTGPDSSSVQRAREMLELHEESYDLQPHQAEWLWNKNNSALLGECHIASTAGLAPV